MGLLGHRQWLIGPQLLTGKIRTLSLEQASTYGKSTLGLPNRGPIPEMALLNQAMCEKFLIVVEPLNLESRTAVFLRDVEGLSNEEVADIMSTTVGRVRSRVRRGRRQICEHLIKPAPEAYRSYADAM